MSKKIPIAGGRILRAAKKLTGKTFDEIGEYSNELARPNAGILLERAAWFLKGCGITLTGLVGRDGQGRRVYISETGECFEITSMVPIRPKPKKVKPHRIERPVLIRCDLNGNELQSYGSLYRTGWKRFNIEQSIERNGTAYGYKWKWEEKTPDE